MKNFIIGLGLLISSINVYAGPSYFVFDTGNNTVIDNHNGYEQKPIASLTKLMTALVIVESEVDLEKKVNYRGGVFNKKQVSRKELLKSLLIKSDNEAAEALARSWPTGRADFISEMNRKAFQLEMFQTTYADPSGRDGRNISTAADQSKLIIAAADYHLIPGFSASPHLTVNRTVKKKVKEVIVANTNSRLLSEFDNITLSKTGFTSRAKRCLALMVEGSERTIAVVILGEPSPTSRAETARYLINTYAKNG